LVYIEYNNHDLGKASERITELELLLEAALSEIERLKEVILRLEGSCCLGRTFAGSDTQNVFGISSPG
jgi:hypothetical protein